MINTKKSVFFVTLFSVFSLSVLLGSLAIIKYEPPIPPTPLVQGVTTETADPAVPANSDSLNTENKLAVQSNKTATRASAPVAKTTYQVKAQSVVELKSGCSGNFTQEFICLLNEYRVSKGKGKLSYNTGLAAVAQSHTNWMSSSAVFSHIDGDGNRFTGRCAEAGIACLAENLAEGFTSASNLLNMWQNSPGHNANLLGNYSTAGLGVQNGYATILMR